MSTPAVIVMCVCGHPERLHPADLDEACANGHECGCVEFRIANGRQLIRTKVCTVCGEEKPRSEFYSYGTGDKVNPKCRDCDNGRRRPQTLSRMLRNRARHRATAALIQAHADEFETLLADATDEVRAEAEALAEHGAEGQMTRLRPGPRRRGQDVAERLDVARCPECAGHHDRGHICTNCGASPQAEAERAS